MIDRTITEAAARLRRHGEPYVVATVVRARRPGARLLLTRYRWLAAGATGAAFEGELAASAWMHTTPDGAPVVLRYDAAHPDIANDEELRAAFGLDEPDAGPVEVMLERGNVPGRIDILEISARCAQEQHRAAVATIIRAEPGAGGQVGTRLALVSGGMLTRDGAVEPALRDSIAIELCAALESGATVLRSFDGADVLIEAIEPPPRLFVFGTGHDLVPLVQLARTIGWQVVICADAARNITRERFVLADEIVIGPPGEHAVRVDRALRAVCVVANHDAERDRACMTMLAGTRAAFIGRLSDLAGESPQDRALSVVIEASPRLTRAPLVSMFANDRPTPSRTSAVFAAAAAL